MRDSLGKRNNNPFNIRYNNLNKWQGLTGQNKGFCVFSSMEFGLRAGIILLKNYVQKEKLHTLEDIIGRFAPASENNTRGYISFVRSHILSFGCDADYIEYNRRNFLLMCEAIVMFESWYWISEFELLSVINKFKIK